MRLSFFVTMALIPSAIEVFAAESVAADRIPLCRDGRSAVYLAAASGLDPSVLPAVDDLRRCFEKLSGAALPSEKAEGLIPLRLGEAGRFPDLRLPDSELGEEGFLLRVAPDGIDLIGDTPAGTRHAIYTLLRDLGCRWIMPGDIGECIPRRADLSLPAGERIGKPDFRYRRVWYAYGCSAEAAERLGAWYRRNRMATPDVRHGHNLTATLARQATFADRPELYSLVGGKRACRQDLHLESGDGPAGYREHPRLPRREPWRRGILALSRR